MTKRKDEVEKDKKRGEKPTPRKKRRKKKTHRVVHQDDDRVEPVPHHRRHVLRRHLERPVSDRSEHAAARRPGKRLGRGRARGGGGSAQRRPHRPPDRTILHLELVAAPFGKLQLQAVEPRVARLCHDQAVGIDEALHALVENICDQGFVGGGLAQRALGHEHALVVLPGRVVKRNFFRESVEEGVHGDAGEEALPCDADAVAVDDDHLFF